MNGTKKIKFPTIPILLKGGPRHTVHHYEKRCFCFIRHFSNWSTIQPNALAACASCLDPHMLLSLTTYCTLNLNFILHTKGKKVESTNVTYPLLWFRFWFRNPKKKINHPVSTRRRIDVHTTLFWRSYNVVWVSKTSSQRQNNVVCLGNMYFSILCYYNVSELKRI